MKKLLLISIALVLALALCACTEDTPTEPTAPTTPTTPHQHNYTMTQTDPTCTVDGVRVYACACGDTYSEPIYAIGHDLGNLTVTKAPSMTETGIGTRVCNSCKDEVTEEIPVHTLEEEVQYFLDRLFLEIPTFKSVEDLTGGSVFSWVRMHIPQVSWEMNDDYIITIVYSIDEMDAFTQKYLGKVFDYTYLAEVNKDHMTIDTENRLITIITGGMGGGDGYTIDTLTDHGDNRYIVRYLAMDPYVDNAFQMGWYYYGNLEFLIVDGHMQLISHQREEK